MSAEGGCAANTEPQPRSWWLINRLPSFDWSLRVPWLHHSPYVALHVSQWGHNLYQGQERRILHVQLMWGRMFTERRSFKVWHPHGMFSVPPDRKGSR